MINLGFVVVGEDGRVIVDAGTLVGKLKSLPGGTVGGLVRVGWFGPG